MAQKPDNEKDAAILRGPSITGPELAEKLRKAKADIAASHGILEEEERGVFSGKGSFRPIVYFDKNPSRECGGLRSHFVFGTAAYEIIGLLEKTYTKHPRPDRFVFIGFEKLQKNCLDKITTKQKSRRAVFGGMGLLKRLGAISPKITLEGLDGWVLPAHDALCKRIGNACHWLGPCAVANPQRDGFFSLTPEGWIWRPGRVKHDDD